MRTGDASRTRGSHARAFYGRAATPYEAAKLV